MGWESYWLPNILQATVFAAIGACVAAVVGLIVRRWLRVLADQMFGEQQRATTAAETAASRAGEAIDHAVSAAGKAETAAGEAKAAGDNSRQANAAIEWLANELAKRDAAQKEMRERIDRLLGTRARELAVQRTAPPTGLLVPVTVGEDDDPVTVTGRHRFHTQRLQTLGEGTQSKTSSAESGGEPTGSRDR